MPVHRVAVNGDLEKEINEIEKTERVVATQQAGEGCVLVFTEPRIDVTLRDTGQVEKRPA